MFSLLILLPIVLLWLTALIMAVVNWLRPKYAYHWLVAAIGAVLSWLAVWAQRFKFPNSLDLLNWGATGLLPDSPSLSVDAVSWVFSLGLATLFLSMVMTDVSRAPQVRWYAWAGAALITSLGILAVTAGNPLTLVITWVVVDTVELVVTLPRVRKANRRRGVLFFFSTSMVGTFVLILADLAASSGGQVLTYESVPTGISLYILLAVGLRTGVLPLQASYLHELPQQRGFGTVARLVAPLATMELLARAARSGVPHAFVPYLLIFIGIAVIYGGVAWARARDELHGRRFWILSTVSLALLAVVQGQPEAVMTWSLALLYVGGVLFLASTRRPHMRFLWVLTVYAFLGLPFSPGLPGSLVYRQPFSLLLILAMVGQVILLLGYVRHMLRMTEPLGGGERWVLAIYSAGLWLLPITYFVTGLAFFPYAPPVWGLATLWPGLVILALAGGIGFLAWRNVSFSPVLFSMLDGVFSLRWFYRLVGDFYQAVGRWLNLVSRLLEGGGGVLWALLLVVLLLSLVTQLGVDVGGGG